MTDSNMSNNNDFPVKVNLVLVHPETGEKVSVSTKDEFDEACGKGFRPEGDAWGDLVKKIGEEKAKDAFREQLA